jgi:hypothetical protein
VSEGENYETAKAVNGDVQDQISSVTFGGNEIADSFDLGLREPA